MSVTSTRPAVLIESMSAGARDYAMSDQCTVRGNPVPAGSTLTSSRELQIKPIKLLSFAICTASLTEMVVRPLL